MMKQSINPYDQTFLYEFDELSDSEIDSGLELAQETFLKHKATTFSYRSELMRKVADELRSNSKKYARTITLEMGKPIAQSVAEVEKCAWVCDYYAENAVNHLRNEPVATDADNSYISYEPLGVVLAVMPWNYPFWQVFRFAAPALMAGNVGILKHASNVMKSATHIQDIFERCRAGRDKAARQSHDPFPAHDSSTRSAARAEDHDIRSKPQRRDNVVQPQHSITLPSGVIEHRQGDAR
jgi:succinate-semialdehyde dehydrogenase/glutarate-semialdehyde dehydrogenase